MTDETNRETEDGPLMDHAYDGIQEYDNPLPKWWVWIFWGSFYFAGFYLLWYHVLPNGVSVREAYNLDMAEYRERMAMQEMGSEVTEEALAKLAADAAMMKDAAHIFQARCAQCHEDGRGKIGPNLTDAYWIHGSGTLLDIHAVVHDGIPAKGMPEWSRQLKPMELRKVVAYVGTLRGKNLDGKGPEGKLVASAVKPEREPASVGPPIEGG